MNALERHVLPRHKFVLIVLSNANDAHYKAFKAFCNSFQNGRGVPSQVVLRPTLRKGLSVATNIVLQILLKLGGQAWALDMDRVCIRIFHRLPFFHTLCTLNTMLLVLHSRWPCILFGCLSISLDRENYLLFELLFKTSIWGNLSQCFPGELLYLTLPLFPFFQQKLPRKKDFKKKWKTQNLPCFACFDLSPYMGRLSPVGWSRDQGRSEK